MTEASERLCMFGIGVDQLQKDWKHHKICLPCASSA